MPEILEFEVNFKKYCKTCKYCNTNENKDPCDECLAVCFNTQSHKPINWKAK